MKGRKVLVFSRDPGGTNAVIQLIEPLRAAGNQLLVYGKDSALSIYRKFGMECSDIRAAAPSGTREETREFVKRMNPDLILTGTSSEDFTERHLWQAGEKAGIATFAVLDQWTNYRLRLIPEGSNAVNGDADGAAMITPSFFFIMDEFAQREMCTLGIDPERLVVTGQPFFDYIRKSGDRIQVHEIKELRGKITGGHGGLVFVFASQPIASIHRQNGIEEDYWGYTEKTVLQSVVTQLQRLSEELETKVTLVVRLHPKDDKYACQDVVGGSRGWLNTVFDREINSTLLLKSADLVIGMFSMVLLEAAILGSPFISVQIGLKRENPLIFDRIGLARSILTEAELEKTLREILKGKQTNTPKLPFHFGATDRIVEYLEAYK
jgi:hypothetical protein